jgi:hypothetical protein
MCCVWRVAWRVRRAYGFTSGSYSYSTEGVAPNRQFVLSVNNAQYPCASGDASLVVVLYETPIGQFDLHFTKYSERCLRLHCHMPLSADRTLRVLCVFCVAERAKVRATFGWWLGRRTRAAPPRARIGIAWRRPPSPLRPCASRTVRRAPAPATRRRVRYSPLSTHHSPLFFTQGLSLTCTLRALFFLVMLWLE